VRAVPGSPAAQAGLRGIDPAGKLGDVIVSANGQPTRRLSDLTDQLEAVGVAREIELSVKRKDRTSNLRVQIEDIGRSS
jgi:2-alkenal reductase